jgi:glucan phosphoethanolaminetransferase (alkaline phosphatase superfamily)
MFCQKCGAENKDDAAFCNSCGEPLKQVEQTLPEDEIKPPKFHPSKNINIYGWIYLLLFAFICLLCIYRSFLNDNSVIIITLPVWLIISFACAYYAAEQLAPRILGSQTIAFCWVFTTSFLGLAIYWILVKQVERDITEKHGGKYWAVTILGIIAILIIGAFLIIAFGAFMSGFEQNSQTQVTTVYPQLTFIPTAAAPPTVAPLIANISSAVPQGWVKYTNYQDGFSVYIPNDWTVKEVTKSEMASELNSENTSSSSQATIMPIYTYIYSPSETGFVLIYGDDFSGTMLSLYADQMKTQISDDIYDPIVFCDGIKYCSVNIRNNAGRSNIGRER